MSEILPNEFPVRLVVNGKEYLVEWYDAEHDADGGCWQTMAIGNGWSWRTLDELVDYLYKNSL